MQFGGVLLGFVVEVCVGPLPDCAVDGVCETRNRAQTTESNARTRMYRRKGSFISFFKRKLRKRLRDSKRFSDHPRPNRSFPAISVSVKKSERRTAHAGNAQCTCDKCIGSSGFPDAQCVRSRGIRTAHLCRRSSGGTPHLIRNMGSVQQEPCQRA